MDDVLFGRLIDAPLDALGERQAAAVAARLAQEPDLLVAASPRRRTQQTACAIAAATHAEVLTAPDLDEVDFGRWSGRRFSELAQDPDWRQWNQQRDRACTPAGDSIARVQARIARHVHRLAAAFPRRTLALVTHAEVIRSTLLWVLEMPATAYARFEIGPSSISTLLWRDGHLSVHGIDERVHLAAESLAP